MESFSTPRHTLVPRVANLATLAVVLAATWWSGAQRPADPATEAALQAPGLLPVQSTQGPTPDAPALLSPAPAVEPDTQAPAAQALWTTQGPALRPDGLQAVGYAATARR